MCTIKVLLRDRRDSKRVILVLALREISYVQQVIATGNTDIKQQCHKYTCMSTRVATLRGKSTHVNCVWNIHTCYKHGTHESCIFHTTGKRSPRQLLLWHRVCKCEVIIERYRRNKHKRLTDSFTTGSTRNTTRHHFHFTDHENVVKVHTLSDKCAIFRNQLKKFQFQSISAIDSLFFIPNVRI